MSRRSRTAEPDFFEQEGPIEPRLVGAGYSVVCGVDEAGRGPLAGPVVAAAVIYRECASLTLACDSKTINQAQREERYDQLIHELDFGVGVASHEEIDRLNILQASLLAMQRAVAGLQRLDVSFILVDGTSRLPGKIPSRAIVGGDATVAVIGAASIIAKVTRDRIMAEYDVQFPEYRFADHKGYPTAEHRRILAEIGPCPIHRKTYSGVREHFQVNS